MRVLVRKRRAIVRGIEMLEHGKPTPPSISPYSEGWKYCSRCESWCKTEKNRCPMYNHNLRRGPA